MRLISLLFAIFVCSQSTLATEFQFLDADLFLSAEIKKKEIERYFSIINQEILSRHGLNVLLVSVTKSFSQHLISGRIEARDCQPSEVFGIKQIVSGPVIAEVPPYIIESIGLDWPLVRPDKNAGHPIRANYLWVPLCQKILE